MQVTVHTKQGCPSCTMVKEFLSDVHVPFTVVEHVTPEERAAIYDRLGLVGGARTMPQVVVTTREGKEMLVGGYEQTLISGIGGQYRRDMAKVA